MAALGGGVCSVIIRSKRKVIAELCNRGFQLVFLLPKIPSLITEQAKQVDV